MGSVAIKLQPLVPTILQPSKRFCAWPGFNVQAFQQNTSDGLHPTSDGVHLLAMASMAPTLVAMASNLLAMASNLLACSALPPYFFQQNGMTHHLKCA